MFGEKVNPIAAFVVGGLLVFLFTGMRQGGAMQEGSSTEEVVVFATRRPPAEIHPPVRPCPQLDAAFADSLPFAASRPGQLVAAVRIAVEEARAGAYERLECPAAQRAGDRGAEHPPNYMGTTCEPWINRETATVLNHYLVDPLMVGMEWSSGSSTLWLLRRLGALYSCEHCGPWLDLLDTRIKAELPWHRKSWFDLHMPCVDNTPGACGGACGQVEGPNANFSAYVAAPAAHFKPHVPEGFDFVSVDGRAREDCIIEVLRAGLLKKKYGLMMLDNAERRIYHPTAQRAPAHWVLVSFMNRADETALWLTCPDNDAYCQRAQAEINQLMALVPHLQGSLWKLRYDAH
jgi:hypothetical protein